MIRIGDMNLLTVASENSSGFYLSEYEGGETVFLPKSMAAEGTDLDMEFNVFVYLDTQQKLIATLEQPYAVVGEYALLEAVEVQDFGAFFDWGIGKDLLVPGNQQKIKVRVGESYLVRVCLEEGTERVYGTTKLGSYIQDSDFDIHEGSKVSVVPVQKTDLGFKVIINKKFIGLIYDSEIFSKIVLLKEIPGVVKKIREDGLVDVSLQSLGVRNLFESKEKVMKILTENGGMTELHDKSSPEEIMHVFGMSKKTFKSAVGMLYKDKKIIISKDGISVIK